MFISSYTTLILLDIVGNPRPVSHSVSVCETDRGFPTMPFGVKISELEPIPRYTKLQTNSF